jgi:hypothetical protein
LATSAVSSTVGGAVIVTDCDPDPPLPLQAARMHSKSAEPSAFTPDAIQHPLAPAPTSAGHMVAETWHFTTVNILKKLTE